MNLASRADPAAGMPAADPTIASADNRADGRTGRLTGNPTSTSADNQADVPAGRSDDESDGGPETTAILEYHQDQ